ncbi:MAG: hypothetical protein Q7S02_04255 [bacterium]|nr:hypothetical protein [bacterium]
MGNTPESLPKTHEEVHLGTYGRCQVLGIESGEYGKMINLRCLSAGRRTAVGDTFKLSAPDFERTRVKSDATYTEKALSQFFAAATHGLARLGPDAWLPFLAWFSTIECDALPPPEAPRESEGYIAELHELHERTLAGFRATQCPRRQSASFRITLRGKTLAVTDDIADDALTSVADAIRAEPPQGDRDTWHRYRRFTADAIVRLPDIARRCIRHIVAQQRHWLRTKDPLDQKRLTRSSTLLTRACGASSLMVGALITSIDRINVNGKDLALDACFAGTDFERNRVVEVLARMITELGCTPDRITLAHEQLLRTRADAVLNEGMPAHLKRPMSTVRFHKHLEIATSQAKPKRKTVADATRAWQAEGKEIRAAFRRHLWSAKVVASTFGVSIARLHTQVRQHSISENILDDRHVFVRRVYLKAIPDALPHNDLVYEGILAVARALHVEPSTMVEPRRIAEDWVREAFIAATTLHAEELTEADVRDALDQCIGSIPRTAKALAIRQRTLIDLVNRFQLWEHVLGNTHLRRARHTAHS